MKAVPALLILATLTGCEQAMQDMYRQPRHDPLDPTALFADGASARTPPAGTVASHVGALAGASGGRRGTPAPGPAADEPLYPLLVAPAPLPGQTGPETARPPRLPASADSATYRRGRERYDIYCAPCHSRVGDGDGMVVRRGFPAPPSFHSERLRGAPARHFFDAMTQGYGAMYPYADRLSPAERWAVVAWIRVLQLSQHAPLEVLEAADRRRLEGAGG